MSSKGRGPRLLSTITPAGQRQFLLPSNHRLRHIQGISLRNLYLPPTEAKEDRAKTLDDESLPQSLSSPDKLRVSQESQTLQHSHSTSDLTSHDAELSPSKTEGKSKDKTPGQGLQRLPSTPRKPRRKSTLEWATDSPSQRQVRLKDAVQKHVADVFFSLHGEGVEEPLYISEVVERAMNPSFGFFDLKAYRTFITRNHCCTVKIWASNSSCPAWTLVLDQPLDLRSLRYVGSTDDAIPPYLPSNTLIIHLTDGIYIHSVPTLTPPPPPTPSFKSTKAIPSSSPTRIQTPTFALPSPTSSAAECESTASYTTLMRLSTLDACIQDALATHSHLATEIEQLITSNHASFSVPTELASARDALATVKRAVADAKKKDLIIHSQIDGMRQGLRVRREAMERDRDLRRKVEKDKENDQERIKETSKLHAKARGEIAAQRRRIVTDLQAIYPVEPATTDVPDRGKRRTVANIRRNSNSTNSSPAPHPLAFTIRNLSLPNSAFNSPSLTTATVSAALGYTAHLLSLLSMALSVPLPYPIKPSASTSSVTDPISLLSTPPAQRQFPLYLPHTSRTPVPVSKYTGTSAFARFEYAVFLLNKDIECLASHTNPHIEGDANTNPKSNGGADISGRRSGLRLLDIRQTLPNLKYIILVVTAGTGEVPGRKRGSGILAGKGMGRLDLLHAKLGATIGVDGQEGSVSGSRRGSDESAGGAGVDGGGEAGRAAAEVRKRLGASTTVPDVDDGDDGGGGESVGVKDADRAGRARGREVVV